MSKSIRDAAVHYLFDEKVGFPGLEKLVIKGLHKLTTLWHTQLDPNSFCKLTEIFVEDCESLIHVLVPRILKRLGSSVCPNLCEVEIVNWRCLKNVFPASVARNRNLEKLQKLYGSLPVVDFFKMKHLFIFCQRITSAVTPSVLFRKCHNLETLGMYDGNFEEIFIHEGSLDGEEHQEPVFPNLETLAVGDCPRLKNIVSSAISFRKIMELEVANYDGMKHLLTYSVAKSFINLEKMTVRNCQRMIEIVSTDDDQGDGENEITFSRLEYLELSDLPNLKGFCSRNYNVRFPIFITIVASHYMEMKISFDGVLLDDSKREKVQIIEEDDDDDDDNSDRDDYDDDDDSRHGGGGGGGGGDDHNNDNEDDDDNSM
ncbi:hypothetical protein FEM48_Zijuj11G0124800 [Ziziphus jujuba var. spinosa]|uniref:Disease resistance protein At4g27190-like leucine-rich repeats domain-containing protein n=1 Tax=Ziziphus jujuba var. spinosa TaxID=714518 RepID=A0A978UIY0_ZIZJJ|nr:hypothetical protein FEM48_Zijuj11G0124800 [Ziziphus jujuba var. spinosa]